MSWTGRWDWTVAGINSAVDGLAAKGMAFQVFPGMGRIRVWFGFVS